MNRKTSLDILKFFAAYLVVFIHADFKNSVSDILLAICRIAVPIFFMISGYFLYTKDKEKTLTSIKKTLKLLIFSDLLYLLFEICKSLLVEQSINEIFKGILSVNFVIFNIGSIASHMWYVRAIIYIYVIYIFIKKIRKDQFLLPLISTIFVLDVFLFKYHFILFDKIIPINIYEPLTKFIGTGFVSVTIGYLIKKNETKLQKINFPLISVSLLLMNLIEYSILNVFFVDTELCNYFFTIPLATSIFGSFLFMKCKNHKNTFVKIGREYSMGIYIFHIIFINIFNVIFLRYNIFPNLYLLFRAPLAFCVTLIFVYICKKIEKLRKKIEV